MKKNILFILGILLISVLVLSFTNVVAVGEVSYCCERTTKNAWCQNSPPAVCSTSINPATGTEYRVAPTSCESTSYCRLGTCIDSEEGTCLENTPEIVCQENSGFWVAGDSSDISQCQLGCCLLGDQAAFVTQSRCERLSAIYGLDTNYRSDIQGEIECIMSASPNVMGACVLDREFQRTCRMLTKNECLDLQGSESVEFHEGYLCSAESLGTICGPDPDRTTCVEDKDGVYFVDTCGNNANIYDATKATNKEYWTYIQDRGESCTLTSSNANSCGNCDYLAGSTCKAYERGNSRTVNPNYGNFVCADLSCEYEGDSYQHGETWCSTALGADENLPGSEHYRLVCYDGEVSVEPCAAFRQETCLQSESNEGYKTAACRMNMWQDCVVQENKKDCEDAQDRDCQWLVDESIVRDKNGRLLNYDKNKEELFSGSGLDRGEMAACVPLYAPGFEFWTEGEADDRCEIANEICKVKWERGLIDDWDPTINSGCLHSDWEGQRNNLCVAIGDCGSSLNYIEEEGYFTIKDLFEGNYKPEG